MDAATSKQKANIKGIFIQGGLPDWIFNPFDFWSINKQDADSLISNLRMMIKCDHEDLKDTIAQSLEGKHIFKTQTKTIDELEEVEEQATFDPTSENWLDQHIYKDHISQKGWIQESQADILREQEVIA